MDLGAFRGVKVKVGRIFLTLSRTLLFVREFDLWASPFIVTVGQEGVIIEDLQGN